MRRKETVSRRPRSTPSVIGQGASSAGVLSLRNGVVRTPTCRAQPSQVKRDKMHANTISTQCRNVSRKATARDLPLSRDPRCYSPCCAVRAQRTARRDFLLRRPPQLGQRVLFRNVQASRCVVVRPALTATATILFPPVLPTYAVDAFCRDHRKLTGSTIVVINWLKTRAVPPTSSTVKGGRRRNQYKRSRSAFFFSELRIFFQLFRSFSQW